MLAWQALSDWTLPSMQRALLGQKAENQYVGVNCGIMDQFASACGVENKLLLLDCRSLEWKPIPLPEDVAIVIADTTIRRKLTSGEYNKRRAACEEAVRLLQQDLPGIRSLRDVSVEEFNRFADKLPEQVSKRARHVVEEIESQLKVGNYDLLCMGSPYGGTALRQLYTPNVTAEVAEAVHCPILTARFTRV